MAQQGRRLHKGTYAHLKITDIIGIGLDDSYNPPRIVVEDDGHTHTVIPNDLDVQGELRADSLWIDGYGGTRFNYGANHDIYLTYGAAAGNLYARTWDGVSHSASWTVWHSGNDGSGSGLDADTLDTYHAQAGTSATDDEIPVVGADGVLKIENDVVVGVSNGSTALTTNDGGGNANVTFNHYKTLPDMDGNSGRIRVNVDSAANPAEMLFQLATGVSEGVAPTMTTALDLTLTSLEYMGNEVWHAGNDGTGSGLDADTLRGAASSTTASNDTIVQRNSSGYIYCNYLNTTANVQTAAPDYVMISNTDSFIRKMALADIAEDIQTYGSTPTFGSISATVTNVRAGDSYLYLSDTLCQLRGDTVVIDIASNYMRPGGDASVFCGTSARRWHTVYSANGVVTTSDDKLKKVKKTTDPETGEEANSFEYSWIYDLQPIEYTWLNLDEERSLGSKGEGQVKYGFSAQQVQSVLPNTDVQLIDIQEERIGLQMDQFIAPIVACLQEQKREIDELKKELKVKHNGTN